MNEELDEILLGVPLEVGPGAASFSFMDSEEAMKRFPLISSPFQVHGCRVYELKDRWSFTEYADAMFTQREDSVVAVRTADCVPVMLNAPDIHAVCAIHAGWKGTLKEIVRNAVIRLAEKGADPALMHAAMGPCICGNCYETGPAIARHFREAGFAGCVHFGPSGREHVDLPAVNREILLDCGLKEENIKMPPLCTLETEGWPSYRHDRTSRRILTFIILMPEEESVPDEVSVPDDEPQPDEVSVPDEESE